jgi:hypothetical protein
MVNGEVIFEWQCQRTGQTESISGLHSVLIKVKYCRSSSEEDRSILTELKNWPRMRRYWLVAIGGGIGSLLSFDAIRHCRLIDLWLNIGFSHAFCLLGVWLGYQIGTPFPYLITKLVRLLRS